MKPQEFAKLKPKQIRMDGGTQPRAEMNADTIEDYAEQMRAGEPFPPVTVFFDGEVYWLSDGFHRMGALLRARPTQLIDAEVIRGTLADAQWHSFSVNKTHGLRRTHADIARTVELALRHPDGARKSDSAIAKHVGVSDKTVAKYRAKLEATSEIPKSSGQAGEDRKEKSGPQGAGAKNPPASRLRVGSDGRTINTAKIGKNSGKKGGKKVPREIRISNNAHSLKRGHSDPCPMIPLQFSPRNPKTAAATILQHFTRSFIESLIAELNNSLSTQGVSE